MHTHLVSFMYQALQELSRGKDVSLRLIAEGFVFLSCFFFQAEDGIRDLTVTGVQTCALPIYVLLGFVPATRGAAYIFNVNVREPIARQRIGYLPELTYYYKFLTAEELLRFYARIFRIPRAEVGPRVDEVLKLVELDAARKRPIKTYSKGMQQRVGLAQALINNPDLLILDEPTSGLDPIGRMKVREIIQRLKQTGKTVFFSSHELGEVETVCDRVAILHQGELKAIGRVSELVEKYECNLEQAFLKVVGYNSER